VTGVDNLWSFYDLTVRFVQNVQTQNCRVRREESALSILAPLPVPVFLGSEEVLQFALTTSPYSSRWLARGFFVREEGL
jgi:hypothetical protein